MSPLHDACRGGDTERVRQLLDEGAPLDEKDTWGHTALMNASLYGHTEVVQLLLDKDALVDVKNEDGSTALMWAARNDQPDVVQLLLGKGAAVDKKDQWGKTALMEASKQGRMEMVRLLLDKGAAVDEKDGITALMLASREGQTEVVQLLLDKGAAVDEKDKDGSTALMEASLKGHTEVAQLLLNKGAAVDVKDKDGISIALPFVVTFDEDQLGRMAAAQVQGQLLKGKGQGSDALDAAATAVLQLVHLAGLARKRALKLRSSDPRSADDHQALFGRLQLAAAACVQNDESGKARGRELVYDGFSGALRPTGEKLAHKLLRSNNGRKALEHAVQIEAKDLLAQPVVQGYIKVAWRREDLVDLGWAWVLTLPVLLLQLLFLLPLVALVPPLDGLLRDRWEDTDVFSFCGSLPRLKYYLLRLPVVKFGLECAADLALALALTFISAADLVTAPVAPLLLVWVGSGLLWEARQVMAFGSDAKLWRDRMYDRVAAYWADSINRVDVMALIFSFAALVAFMTTSNSEDAPTATSLRAVAVFLLWLRVIRVLLISPKFGPFVMMFFRMLFGDVLYFLVLLGLLLVAFAASWTVLLEPSPSLLDQQFGDDWNWRWTPSHAAHLKAAGSCADELGGLDIFSTLQMLVEGALTGNDFFECARDSTKSPLAAWAISLVFVTLTSVLLLNMLIAMMAKTFDNISEASATNYLFLFAQRTLALQNEPPTPPPLIAIGLPCHAMCLLWARLHPKKKKRAEGEAVTRVIGGGQQEDNTALAEKITEYILDNQDDAAQEERWRTTMKRDTMKRFREQRDEQREHVQKIEAAVQKVETEMQAMQLKMDENMDQLIKLIKK